MSHIARCPELGTYSLYVYSLWYKTLLNFSIECYWSPFYWYLPCLFLFTGMTEDRNARIWVSRKLWFIPFQYVTLYYEKCEVKFNKNGEFESECAFSVWLMIVLLYSSWVCQWYKTWGILLSLKKENNTVKFEIEVCRNIKKVTNIKKVNFLYPSIYHEDTLIHSN